jgi:hypothetical protein
MTIDGVSCERKQPNIRICGRTDEARARAGGGARAHGGLTVVKYVAMHCMKQLFMQLLVIWNEVRGC